MRYYLDAEFNEFGGELISLALVCENGLELYLATACIAPGEWVAQNVIPIIKCEGATPLRIEPDQFGAAVAWFLQQDNDPIIVADWPDDIRYFCQALISGPGEMVAIQKLGFELRRVDAYPSQLPGAVQHNALWDARALQHRLTKHISPARIEDRKRGLM
jgi:hypothetical protein